MIRRRAQPNGACAHGLMHRMVRHCTAECLMMLHALRHRARLWRPDSQQPCLTSAQATQAESIAARFQSKIDARFTNAGCTRARHKCLILRQSGMHTVLVDSTDWDRLQSRTAGCLSAVLDLRDCLRACRGFAQAALLGPFAGCCTVCHTCAHPAPDDITMMEKLSSKCSG